MNTLKEIKKMYEGLYDDIELYVPRFSGESHRGFHTDYIKAYEDAEVLYTEEQLDSLTISDCSLMDESDYDRTICANSCIRADFNEWYDDKDAKVLVCLVVEEK